MSTRDAIIYEGHKITYSPTFMCDGMKYQWMLKDTSTSFIVMQHDTIEEAFATIDLHVKGELI